MNDERPLYLQIMEIVEDDILGGVYSPNDIIISTTQIARLYSVNPTTAVKAISELTDKGILYKKRGIGMAVTGTAKDAILRERTNVFFGESIHAFIAAAMKLGITREALAQMILEENKEGKNPHD